MVSLYRWSLITEWRGLQGWAGRGPSLLGVVVVEGGTAAGEGGAGETVVPTEADEGLRAGK